MAQDLNFDVDWAQAAKVFRDLQEVAHHDNIRKGFYDSPRNMGEMLCLVHSEISEALEEHRINQDLTTIRTEMGTGKPVGFPVELADTFIRIFDICGANGIDLIKAIEVKLAYNRTRPRKHNRAY